MASVLGEFLTSINNTKQNTIRESDSPEQRAKEYPAFLVNRTLSYFGDCILFVNELNARGLSEFHVSNTMHYEFLLHVIPRGKRFAKWAKPDKDNKDIKAVSQYYNCNSERARDIVSLLSEEQMKVIHGKLYEGGKNG